MRRQKVLDSRGLIEHVPDIDVDDLVATPYGDARVVAIDIAKDLFTTESLESGVSLEWELNEIEEIAAPADRGDVEAMDRWLRLKAMVVPRLDVETDTFRCSVADCDCEHCYRIVKTIRARGMTPRNEIAHYADNDVCTCGGGCECIANVSRAWWPQ